MRRTHLIFITLWLHVSVCSSLSLSFCHELFSFRHSFIFWQIYLLWFFFFLSTSIDCIWLLAVIDALESIAKWTAAQHHLARGRAGGEGEREGVRAGRGLKKKKEIKEKAAWALMEG
jgi:hypothetical protein